MKEETLFFNTASLLPTWVGFDRIFDEMERVNSYAKKVQKSIGYPPYNVKKIDENHYTIEIACAGFATSDIDITTKDTQLVIKGQVTPNPDDNYVFKGIAERAFERTFTLADSVTVKNATMVNGLLKVWLEQFIPEEKLPKKIEVKDVETPDLKTVKSKKQLLTE